MPPKGVTGTQHAPVESQIETVASVSAQLAPSRHADSDARQAERPLRGLQCRTGNTQRRRSRLTTLCHHSEPRRVYSPQADSLVLDLGVDTETRRLSTSNCTQRSTTPAASTAPDTQRQVVRDTPIYSSRHARPASRPVRVPSSESDSVARAGHTAAGPATLRPGWLSSVL